LAGLPNIEGRTNLRGPMSTKIAINGFGRIGRCVVRALVERKLTKELEVVLVNDLTDARTLAHLYDYDTVHGRAEPRARAIEGGLELGGMHVKVTAEKDPAKLPLKELGVSVMLECTGLFTDREKAAVHLQTGAKKVLISAPAKNQDATIVMGVNDETYDPQKHHVLSNGSCTTNCLAPVAKVLLDNFGLQHGLMTTIHSYTNDQSVLDIPHRKGDLRRARAAAMNMIPTSTGAAKALSEVIPALKGKFDGQSIRVPTMDVSVIDLTFTTEKSLTKDSIHAAMKAASEGPMKGILGYTEEPLVSSDYIGDPRSSIFDATITQVMGDKFAKVFSWYDNEWGFSNRMIDLAQLVGSKL
jgi:glyceraldehyde 3-phosphate dehydrogenase